MYMSNYVVDVYWALYVENPGTFAYDGGAGDETYVAPGGG